MSELFYFLLGLIQGLTEFLPVSSSGHLALAQSLWSNIQKESLLIEITAHLGSLFAIGFYYRKSFWTHLQSSKSDLSLKRLYPIWILFISTLPAGLAGLFLKDHITKIFVSTRAVAFGFLFTSFALLLNYFLSRTKSNSASKDWPSPLGALFIGFAQALALLPGISRSGSTIAAGILAGLKPKQSAFFSFCSVAPLILAASAMSLYKFISHAERLSGAENPLNLSILLLSSFVFGWFGLSLVVRFLEKERFHYFAFYLIPLASLILIWG